jgi:hypothetical protein
MDTEPEGSLDLWAVPRMVVTTQLAAGAVFLLMALVNLLQAHPSGWERFIGVVAAVVAGMAFGVGGVLRSQGRMVRRHMAAWHPDLPVPQRRRAVTMPAADVATVTPVVPPRSPGDGLHD